MDAGTNTPGKELFHISSISTLRVYVNVPEIYSPAVKPGGELLPGSCEPVHLKLPVSARAVTIPVNALLFRSEGWRAAVVKNGRAELTRIRIGHGYGDEVEIVSGLTPADSVIVNPSDSIVSGEQVEIATGGTEVQ